MEEPKPTKIVNASKVLMRVRIERIAAIEPTS
jgi:hypothetical protein